jgi:hypothetical protein
LVLIVAAFLTAAVKLDSVPWVSATLVIAAVVFVPVFLVAAMLMQTKFRPEILGDEFYSKYLTMRFDGFRAENPVVLDKPSPPSALDRCADEPEQRRIERYKSQEGLFLVHAWRSSQTPGQVADIVIWLRQHKEGPLTRGEVERVEYYLGPKFFKRAQVKKNSRNGFKLEVSAYYPVLCLARVYLRGRREPIELDRYVDFDVPAANLTDRASTPVSISDSSVRSLPPRISVDGSPPS